MNEGRNINAAMGTPLGGRSYAVETEREMVIDEGPTEAYEPVMEERAVENPSYGKRDITIRHLHHGYIVEVDCHRFAFETVDRMMKYIGEYLKDPGATEKKWWNKELF